MHIPVPVIHLFATVLISLPITLVTAASLKAVSHFGSNPTNIQMNIYVPDKLAANPPVILAMHPCGGNAQGYYGMTKLPSYANKYGFILIYPQTTHDFNCWDVATNASLTHGGNGDSAGLVSMVNYVIMTYKADPKRVFATGSSSGAMETNNLAGAYPDVFAGGASFSGFPYGCRRGASSSSPISDTGCPLGQVVKTQQGWMDELKKGFPGYTGSYPKMFIAHGTADNLVVFSCYTQQMMQWSAAHNITLSKEVTNAPSSGYTEQIYGDGTKLLGIVQQNGQHFTPYQEEMVLKFFGII
ncbi:PHB depolymerase family esterase [Crepidotus variabilis]|uniref:Carboxylic ester hydrolase n=1 Tax=Crepidotus variabilis TaxID=179855 RepID=A0A9P6E8X2_9AGAR|nr:PHB depolymerase family esterase [Crepidotus variabilis]